MNGDAVKELADQFSKPQLVGGFLCRPSHWTADDPAMLAKEPACTSLLVSTLGAVRDYLETNRDHHDLATLQVQVIGPHGVAVLGPLHPRTRGREVFLTASALDLSAGWVGKYWPLDEFLIGIRTRFVNAHDQQQILALLSNVKNETVRAALDDGLTQVVQARSGVALVTDVAVPRSVVLAPYRTFRDLHQQPASLFIVRLQAGKVGGLPEAALFEADGGAWRLAAIDLVREWLQSAEGFPDAVAVLA